MLVAPKYDLKSVAEQNAVDLAWSWLMSFKDSELRADIFVTADSAPCSSIPSLPRISLPTIRARCAIRIVGTRRCTRRRLKTVPTKQRVAKRPHDAATATDGPTRIRLWDGTRASSGSLTIPLCPWPKSSRMVASLACVA
jgi:hypothetical protein